MTTLVRVHREGDTRVDWPWRFLALITAIPPHAWAAIPQRGRVHERLVDRVGEVVAHLPYPMPHEAVIGARLLQGLAAATRGAGIAEEVEHWCVVGWPSRWPAPSHTRGLDEGLLFAGAALAAARIAESSEHREVREEFARVAERLAVRAVRS
ncbi:hypothetical protein [Phycicoccus flavus]|uniref:hypothetical protein n=1 Tax=Phycicoccus flavus TaxID=2502783 RepID=UPI000FEBC2BB|nr:hypothetical protein [Phycicoccus flavus]NHA68882.1 hypothetical protein [Phycicoccus flavus]